MELKRKLAKLMAERDWKATKVALLLGELGCVVSDAKVRRWADETAKNPPTPSVKEAYLLARLFGVPLEYLADDAQDEPTASLLAEAEKGLSEEERIVLRTYRKKGLSVDEAVEALVMGARARDSGDGVVEEFGTGLTYAETERLKQQRGGGDAPPRRSGSGT